MPLYNVDDDDDDSVEEEYDEVFCTAANGDDSVVSGAPARNTKTEASVVRMRSRTVAFAFGIERTLGDAAFEDVEFEAEIAVFDFDLDWESPLAPRLS